MLTTVPMFRRAFFRLTGSELGDHELDERGEDTNEVVNQCLTGGAWAAQRDMLSYGYRGWLALTPALVWVDDPAVDSGLKAELPANLLRLAGDEAYSALLDSSSKQWGQQIEPDWKRRYSGKFYYVETEEFVHLTKNANPPSGLRAEYHYRHPEFDADLADGSIDLPVDARMLVVAHAAMIGVEENWIVGADDMKVTVARNLLREQNNGRKVARRTKQQRRMRRPPRFGTRY